MKYATLLLVVLSLVSCGGEKNNKKAELSKTKPNKSIVTITNASDSNGIKSPPSFSDYIGVCPKLWGLVEGASQVHVEKFIQNFFFVPENPGPMYSDINTYPQAGGSILIKAATYKMVDKIVDQEMVTMFTGGKMTQCGVRFRCESNTSKWVASCD